MTKDEILDKHVKYAWECDQASPVIPFTEASNAMDEWVGYLISQRSSITTAYDIPKHILDAFAKQQAIAFGEWVDVNAVRNGFHNWMVGCGSDRKEYTSEQLYELFIQQNENK